MPRTRSRLLKFLPKRAVGAEIGVWKGDFSAQIIEVAQPTKLYLIDPWALNEDEAHRTCWYGAEQRPDMETMFETVRQRFQKELRQGSLAIIRQPSSVALGAMPDESLDFVYIDGDHQYRAVRQDCFLAYDKVKPGGLICGDDYADGGWWKDGVIQAFHELIAERNVVITYARGSQIVLRKREGSYNV